MPTAAFTQIVAAVVIPWTLVPLRRIAPPPRNPMPVTICAAMRSGVPPACAIWIETMVKSADPSAIRMLVRRPAGFLAVLALEADRGAEAGPPAGDET